MRSSALALTCTAPASGERYGGSYRVAARDGGTGCGDELGARAETLVGILGHRPGDDCIERGGKPRSPPADGGRLLVHVSPHELQLALERERSLTRQALV